jgi:hypothetical protein
MGMKIKRDLVYVKGHPTFRTGDHILTGDIHLDGTALSAVQFFRNVGSPTGFKT